MPLQKRVRSLMRHTLPQGKLLTLVLQQPNNSFKPSPHRYGADRTVGLGVPA